MGSACTLSLALSLSLALARCRSPCRGVLAGCCLSRPRSLAASL
nr:MAG TPA: hypothetical protein [Caudoviricetes sp.]